MARVVIDLDGTLVGFRHDGTLALNRKLLRAASNLRAQGHTMILWTLGNRKWWREVARQYPVLRQLFHEVYSRDELPGRVTEGRGFPEAVKDLRIVNGDVLIDNEPAHLEWARRHGLQGRYILVPTFGAA